jgi:hypothetical protein
MHHVYDTVFPSSALKNKLVWVLVRLALRLVRWPVLRATVETLGKRVRASVSVCWIDQGPRTSQGGCECR